MSNPLDLAVVEIIEARPSGRGWLGERDGEHFSALRGAKILKIGTLANPDLEGGGLAIDYETVTGKRRRIVFAFNENGMWIVYHGCFKCGT